MNLIMRIARGKGPPKPGETDDEEGSPAEENGEDYETVKDEAVDAMFEALKSDDKPGLKAALEDFMSACQDK